MAKGPIGKLTRDTSREALERQLAEYREYLDKKRNDLPTASLKQLIADAKVEPGTKNYERLKSLSDRLADVQETDFRARQIKEEIDRALNQAVGAPTLADSFSMKSRDDS